MIVIEELIRIFALLLYILLRFVIFSLTSFIYMLHLSFMFSVLLRLI